MSIVSGAAKQASTRGFYPKVIEGSLRFNDDDGAYLSWTPASAGNRKTWTLSFWIKRTNLTDKSILDTTTGTSDSANILFQPDDTLRFQSYLSSSQQFRLTTTQVFRDVSAWYHFVFVLDTTNATSSERARIYVNGERVSNFSTENYPTQNLDCQFNIADIHLLGVRGYAATQFLDAYLADVYFIDGQALSASDFGETKNGVWVAKDYEGTFGTNGFHLTFEDDTEVEAFNTVLYRGTGTDNTSITGMGFQPDLLWIKTRNTGTYHNLFDAVRTDVNGMPARLYPNETLAEEPSIYSTETGNVKDFESDGFLLGNGGNTNTSGNSYVAWGWKAGDSNVSNTDGSITSTVRANDTYGFSIVSYTGTGTAGDSFGHGLSSTPDMIFIKDRSAANSWTVWHSAIMTNAGYLVLDGDQAANTTDTGYWNATAPSSSVVTLGTRARVNTNTNNYIAYCWAEKSGYSKFGSYVGSSGDPSVTTGFKPAFVLIKRTDASGNSWNIWDNTRDTDGDGNLDLTLFPNLSNAEDTSSYTDYIQFTDTGFVVKGNGAFVNGGTSSYEYIYAAFADTREAAFWLDQSGNDNDWQPVNLDHNDTVADSPTDNFATLNPLCPSATNVYADGNLRLHMTDKSNGSNNSFNLPTIQPLNTGKIYYEFVTGVQTGSGNAVATGLIGADKKYYDILFAGNADVSGFYLYNGSVDAQNTGTGTAGVASYSNGDTIGIAIDFDNQKMYCFVNGSEVTGQSISSGTAVVTFPTAGDHHFFLTCGSNTGGSNTSNLTVNFGQQPFKYDPPE